MTAQHTIAWTITDNTHGLGASITGTVACHAPAGSTCRLICDSGCEEWSFDDHEHPLVDASNCLVAGWLNAEDLAEVYTGGEHPLRDGRITTAFDGDSLTWQYATTTQEGTTP